jgi:hypothetical protein
MVRRSLLCRVHLRTPLPERQLFDYGAFEELTAATHDLLWEIESRARRRVRTPMATHSTLERARLAVRRAQDCLLPTQTEEVR